MTGIPAAPGISQENQTMGLSGAQKIFSCFGFLTGGKVLGDLFTFVLFIALSRTFGEEGIGQYSFAMALTGFFVVFADFGLYTLSIKEMSVRTGTMGEYYGGLLSVRFLLSVTVLGILLLVLNWLPFSRDTKLIIALIGTYQLLYVLLDGFAAICVAREHAHLAGLLEVILKASTSLIGIAICLAGGSLITTVVTLPVISLGLFFIVYILAGKRYGRLQLGISWSDLTGTLRRAIPYAVFVLLRQLSTRADIVILGCFLGVAAAGIYNVGYRVVFLLLCIPYYAGLALLPRASQHHVSSRKELGELYNVSLNLTILVGVPGAAGLCLIAPQVIHLIFGETFSESASILRFLAWLFLLFGLKSIMGTFLTASDRQADRTRCQWGAARVNVLGNLLLVPTMGIVGAAVANLISETVLVILLAAQVRGTLGWPRIGQRLAMSTVATSTFCLPFALFPMLPIGIMVPVSILLYLGSLLLFKDFRRKELRLLSDILRREPGAMLAMGQEMR